MIKPQSIVNEVCYNYYECASWLQYSYRLNVRDSAGTFAYLREAGRTATQPIHDDPARFGMYAEETTPEMEAARDEFTANLIKKITVDAPPKQDFYAWLQSHYNCPNLEGRFIHLKRDTAPGGSWQEEIVNLLFVEFAPNHNVMQLYFLADSHGRINDVLTQESLDDLRSLSHLLSTAGSRIGQLCYQPGVRDATAEELHQMQVALVGLSACLDRIRILADREERFL